MALPLVQKPAKQVLSNALYCSVLALCLSSTLLPHLNVGHEGTVYKFLLFSEESGTGNTLLGEAAHQAASREAYLVYSACAHFLLCFFSWMATDMYFRRSRVPKWLRYALAFVSFACFVAAAIFILVADGFSTPGVSSTKRDMSSIASRTSFQHAYRVQGYRGSGALMLPIIPVACCFLGFAMHE